MGCGYVRLDTPNQENILQAARSIRHIGRRQRLIVCRKEIACRMGFVDADVLRKLADPMGDSAYGRYLLQVLEDRVF